MSIKGLFNSAATVPNGYLNDISVSLVIMQDSVDSRVTVPKFITNIRVM
jgi:hypothetical protein